MKCSNTKRYKIAMMIVLETILKVLLLKTFIQHASRDCHCNYHLKAEKVLKRTTTQDLSINQASITCHLPPFT